jgi:uncharacterized iron-regulated protein
MVNNARCGTVCAVLAASIVTLTLGACASAEKAAGKQAPLKAESARTVSDAEARSVRIARLIDGRATAASWADVVTAAAESDCVLIGENHGHTLGLASAAALWQDILVARAQRSAGTAGAGAGNGEPRPTLAMEFFERDEQKAIDDYFAGLIDEATFEKESQRSQGNYPPGHRAMVRAAKEAGARLVAANAPRRYVRLARTDGYERLRGLSEEQRRLFRLPDVMPMNAYWDRFVAVMGGSAEISPTATPAEREAMQKKRANLEATFRSQVMWDWTMAQSVADARYTPRGISKPVVLVVGRFHIDDAGGTVQALRRLAPQAKILTVSFVDSEGPKDPSVAAAKDDLTRADFVVYVGQ